MSRPVLSEKIFADFCRHLSASINVVDLLYKLRQLSSPQFDPNADDPIVLTVSAPAMVPRLVEFEYPQFLEACVSNLRVLESCSDVFRSEIDDKSVELFENVFEHIAPRIQVETGPHGFVLHAPGILADLILCPIGRVHQEILRSLANFTEMLAAVDNDPTKLFLNAKSPTPESQYLQFWVASNLNIPLAPEPGLTLVV